jgi:hypothetical protein
VFNVRQKADEIARLWFIAPDPTRQIVISREIYDYAAFRDFGDDWTRATPEDVVRTFEMAAEWNMFRVLEEPAEERLKAARELLKTVAAMRASARGAG